MIRFRALISILILIQAACGILPGQLPNKLTLPAGTGQVVYITAQSWDESFGTLSAFQREGGRWRSVLSAIPVTLGKHGLGWGPGFDYSGPQKREGDGRSPAGIFGIGQAFGTLSDFHEGLKLPYKPVTGRDYFVDDSASSLYNQWLTIPDSLPNRPERYADSFEHMQRGDGLYELGAVVHYNMNPVIPARGSAIFLHKWRNSLSPTLGCTAMSEKNLVRLLRWLDPELRPVLIQLPHEAVKLIDINDFNGSDTIIQ